MSARMKERVGLFLLHLLEEDPKILSLCSVPELASIYSQEMGCELTDRLRRRFIRIMCSILCELLNFQESNSSELVQQHPHVVKILGNNKILRLNNLNTTEVSLQPALDGSHYAPNPSRTIVAPGSSGKQPEDLGSRSPAQSKPSFQLATTTSNGSSIRVHVLSRSPLADPRLSDVQTQQVAPVIISISSPTIATQSTNTQPSDSPPYITVRRKLNEAVISVRPAQSRLVEET